jgi:hypothetical protein
MEIMDKNTRRKYAIVCFLPVISMLIAAIYYIVVISPLIAEKQLHNHLEMFSLLDTQGNIVMGVLLLTFLIHIASLIYCLVHIARVKYMNPATKIVWAVFLAAFQPISFIFFYFWKIKREPRHLETYADIA